VLTHAAAAGFPVASLTRPGYPADQASARQQPSFSAAADIVSAAVADVWDRLGHGRPGIVILGHSIGGAIAIHLAARTVSWPLLGLAVSGVGDKPSAGALGLGSQLPVDLAMDFSLEAFRPLVYGPDWTLHPYTLTNAADLGVCFPSADLREITTRWLDDLPQTARQIEVPLHYVLTEFDGLWLVSQDRVDRFASYFSEAPLVDASLWRCAGHNIEHHRLGDAYVRAVLGFADRCAIETHRTTKARL
jgi:pimeloyl-ACP methyl ester carboxylesterase